MPKEVPEIAAVAPGIVSPEAASRMITEKLFWAAPGTIKNSEMRIAFNFMLTKVIRARQKRQLDKPGGIKSY